jgi:hypothetical protein
MTDINNDHDNWFDKRFWTGLLSGAVLILLAHLLQSVFTAAPDLRYTISPANVVSVNGNSSAVYALHFRNSGKMMAKNVKLTIGVPSATISKISVSATDNLDLNLKPEGSSEEIDIPTLNTSESIDVQLQADRTGALPNRPDVSVRGDDCVGKEEDKRGHEFSWLDLMSPVFVLILLAFFWLKSGKMLEGVNKTAEEEDKKRTEVKSELARITHDIDELKADNLLSPRFVLAYACRVAGDSKMADEYLRRLCTSSASSA